MQVQKGSLFRSIEVVMCCGLLNWSSFAYVRSESAQPKGYQLRKFAANEIKHSFDRRLIILVFCYIVLTETHVSCHLSIISA